VTIASEVPEAIGADPLLEELRELNVNVLLSESQRQAKRRYLIEREGQRLAEQIERALSAGDVDAARERLDRFVRLVPDDPRIEPLGRRIERARAEAEARDVGEARKRIENLMSVGDFAGAEAVANGLLARHPAAADAVALLARVRREREAFVREQRLALYQRVEKEAAGRHWRGALSAAEELIAGHPGSPECDAVGAQLETLRENARIEEARQLRDRIRELIAAKRFAEAADAARDLIARFPDTAAAGELRQQMPRLAELAATGGGSAGVSGRSRA
jgi:tetratricopeptide (TPR) repeat protein